MTFRLEVLKTFAGMVDSPRWKASRLDLPVAGMGAGFALLSAGGVAGAGEDNSGLAVVEEHPARPRRAEKTTERRAVFRQLIISHVLPPLDR